MNFTVKQTAAVEYSHKVLSLCSKVSVERRHLLNDQ